MYSLVKGRAMNEIIIEMSLIAIEIRAEKGNKPGLVRTYIH